MRWFARKPKEKAPVLKPPADRVRMRRIRGDLPTVESPSPDRGDTGASADTGFTPGQDSVTRHPN